MKPRHHKNPPLRIRLSKPDDIIIEIFMGPGGDSMTITHKPTGIRRGAQPPLAKPGKTRYNLLREIEAELIVRGLTQYLLPEKGRPA